MQNLFVIYSDVIKRGINIIDDKLLTNLNMKNLNYFKRRSRMFLNFNERMEKYLKDHEFFKRLASDEYDKIILDFSKQFWDKTTSLSNINELRCNRFYGKINIVLYYK